MASLLYNNSIIKPSYDICISNCGQSVCYDNGGPAFSGLKGKRTYMHCQWTCTTKSWVDVFMVDGQSCQCNIWYKDITSLTKWKQDLSTRPDKRPLISVRGWIGLEAYQMGNVYSSYYKKKFGAFHVFSYSTKNSSSELYGMLKTSAETCWISYCQSQHSLEDFCKIAFEATDVINNSDGLHASSLGED